MTGYVRKDTSNNIADGNIINAADLDAEFDGVVDAFNASTGHKHDGTTGEGAPITVVGPTQDVTVSATAVTPKTTNTVDLGSSSLKFKDIFIAGTATLPTVSATTVGATTGNITTVNATTVDTTNVEVTNIKAKDGTSAATIADTTGAMTIASAILTTADINGGTIDGTTIGGTTAAAGAFTTLSASAGITGNLTGNVTGNVSGNAGSVTNGVYTIGDQTIGGIKTFTSTIVGSISGNAATVTNGVYTIGDQTIGGIKTFSSNPVLSAGTANGVAYLNGSKVLTTGSALTFDGTNFLIGGASALAKLSVLTSGAGNDVLNLQSSDAEAAAVFRSPTGAYLNVVANTYLRFGVNNAEQMRLTSTGLGIGTSSLNGTYAPKLQVESSASNGTGGIFIGSYMPTLTLADYSASAAYGQIRQDGNNFQFIADVGDVASNSYMTWCMDGPSFEKMRLDVNGNLGLGVTPSAYSQGKALDINTNMGAWASGSGAVWSYNTYFNSGYKYKTSDVATMYVQGSQHQWHVAASGTAGNAITFTQAMTLDASGNLGLNTSSPVALNSGGGYFTVNNASSGGGVVFQNNAANIAYSIADTDGLRLDTFTGKILKFGIQGSERARIDSSGNLLVGTTSTSTTSGGFTVQPAGGQSYSVAGHISGTGSGAYYYACTYNGSVIGGIAQSGTTNVSLLGTSDHRLKENVRPADAKRFMDIEFVDFEWIDGRHDCGVIAHKLQAIYPDLVVGEKDGTEEDGKPKYQQVNYIGLIPRIGTRVQDQERRIETLEATVVSLMARIAALEAPSNGSAA